MFSDARVFVAGGTGLIGHHVVDELLHRGARVRVVIHRRPNPFGDRVEAILGDLREAETCRRAMTGCRFAIHAAGVTGGLKSLTLNPFATFTDNALLNTTLLEAARLEGVERYALVSNTSVYADSAELLREEDAWGTRQGCWEENHTGAVKRLAELQCRLYSAHTPMKLAIVRGGNGYGPYDDFASDTSHVVGALVRKAVEGPRPLILWGSGETRRDFTHARDIARGVLHMLEHYAVCDPVHVATGKTTSINEVARLILAILGEPEAEIVHDLSGPEGPKVKRIDVQKMRRLGFDTRIPLEEGLRETIDWYRSSRP